MSDISALSNQYDQLVATSEKINNSVIVFKKQNLLKDTDNKKNYPKLSISQEEIIQASTVLSLFLDNVFRVLSNEPLVESEFMPLTVIDDYKKRLNKNAYLDEDLKRLQHHLNEKQPVTEGDLKAMDILVTTLDTERNNLFRKLRTDRRTLFLKCSHGSEVMILILRSTNHFWQRPLIY